MASILIRTTIMLVSSALGAFLALSVPRHLFYSAPANSFDEVFYRMGLLAICGFGLGFVAGVAVSGVIGRRSLDPSSRWGLTVIAAMTALIIVATGLLAQALWA